MRLYADRITTESVQVKENHTCNTETTCTMYKAVVIARWAGSQSIAHVMKSTHHRNHGRVDTSIYVCSRRPFRNTLLSLTFQIMTIIFVSLAAFLQELHEPDLVLRSAVVQGAVIGPPTSFGAMRERVWAA